MRRVLRLIGVLSLMAGCREQLPSGPSLTDPSSRPASLISDGAHSAGNPNFFFLPPTGPDPSSSPAFDVGQFDGSQTPTVEVCQLVGGACGAIVAAFASSDIAVSLADESYSVNWNTRASRLDPAFIYRIRVLIGTFELGFADVKVVNNGRDLRAIDTRQYIALLNGRMLPIKFRIERNALPGTIEIDNVALASTQLAIGGAGVSYTATVTNGTSTTETVVVLQGWIEQGTASRAAGGLQVTCGAGVGVLPPGTCTFGFTLSASNSAAGSGTLVPGPAIARFELKNASGTFDEFTVPVTLVKAVTIDGVTLSSTQLAIGGVGAEYVAHLSNRTAGPLSVVVLQTWIEQGSTTRAAGGLQMNCGAGIGVLPAGTCDLAFTLGASNTAAGTGTLVPGPATARFVLQSGDGTIIYDEFTVPVTLVKAVTIDDVTLSTTTLAIGGVGAEYVAHLSNRTFGPLSVVVLQTWIEQGSAIRAAGGLQMNCGAGIGVLPAGTCDLPFTLGASNSTAGTGTLVPGPAIARFVLQSGDGTIIYDEFTAPVTLVKPVTIDAVSISSTTLTIDGDAVTYTATVTNRTGSTLSVTVLQGWIDQGSASRAAGGLQVDCGAGVGELPPGTCAVSFTLGAMNGTAGTGTLVPGAATARWVLKNGTTDAEYDVFTMAVTLH